MGRNLILKFYSILFSDENDEEASKPYKHKLIVIAVASVLILVVIVMIIISFVKNSVYFT